MLVEIMCYDRRLPKGLKEEPRKILINTNTIERVTACEETKKVNLLTRTGWLNTEYTYAQFEEIVCLPEDNKRLFNELAESRNKYVKENGELQAKLNRAEKALSAAMTKIQKFQTKILVTGGEFEYTFEKEISVCVAVFTDDDMREITDILNGKTE